MFTFVVFDTLTLNVGRIKRTVGFIRIKHFVEKYKKNNTWIFAKTCCCLRGEREREVNVKLLLPNKTVIGVHFSLSCVNDLPCQALKTAPARLSLSLSIVYAKS